MDGKMDVARARAETPGCAEVMHFNNAGAALMPACVADAVRDHLALETRRGGYEAADAAHDALEHFHDAGAALLGCHRDEIAFIENATRAWDMAFYALPLQPGDVILTCQAEYASNYIAYLQRARQTGAVVEAVPNDETGALSLPALEEALGRHGGKAKLVAITHVPTNGGLVQPAAQVGQLARAAGVPYLLDACQSAGQMPLDVEALGCDMLSLTGRKYLRGPRGTGLLYVRRAMLPHLEPPFLDLHAAEWTARDAYEMRPDARRFENWECFFAGKIGLGVAMDYARAWGLEAIQARNTILANALRGALEAIPGVATHDLGAERCAITTFTVAGVEAGVIQSALAARNINVSTTTTSGTRLDMETRGLDGMVRASVHYYNTQDEIDALAETVAGLATGA